MNTQTENKSDAAVKAQTENASPSAGAKPRLKAIDAFLLRAGLSGGYKNWYEAASAVLEALAVDLEANEPQAVNAITTLRNAMDYVCDPSEFDADREA